MGLQPPCREGPTEMPMLTRTKTTPTRPRFLPCLLPLALLVACGDTGEGPATGAAGALDGPDVIVNAVTEEVFTVGSVMGNDWDTFGSVRSVHFDAQANLHIFDSQADHIVVVGQDGSLIRTVGGQGEGPGEFEDVITAIVGRDGSYTVLGFTQIDLLEPDGEFVRRITLNPMTTGLVMADLALPDGRLVGHFRRLGDDDEQSEEGGRPVHIFPLDGSEAELLYTAWELPEENESSVSESASSGMVMRMSAGRAFEPLLEFDILTDREGVEGRTFADEVPVLYRLKVDWEDRIWLQRRGPTGQGDGPTDIVTPDGDYIGTLPPDELRTPDAFGPDGLLAYIEHDDMDVSTVRVIRLVALEPGG